MSSVVRIYGGLGNQLFQYAFGKVLEKHGESVAYEVSWYERRGIQQFPRPYRLTRFNTTVNTSRFLRQRDVKEKEYDESLFELKNCNFIGYWQYISYYEPIVEELRQEFWLKHENYGRRYIAWKEIITKTSSIGIHIRRGDYLLRNYGVLPLHYYFRAINEMPEGDLFIFSDDLPWCREVLKEEYFGRKIYFVDADDFACMELLRFCDHIIMSASTFSWWPAFLKTEGKIIVPKYWMITSKEQKIGFDSKRFYRDEWIKI